LRHTAANGEDAHALGGEHGVGELFEVFEWIETQKWTLLFCARHLVQGEIDSEFRVGKCRED